MNKRDKGICKICGMDTFLVHRIARRMDDDECAIGMMVLLGWSASKAERGILWEADHILPLVEGGSHALDNLRVLCVPCHVKVTSELAGRIAKRRKAKKS